MSAFLFTKEGDNVNLEQLRYLNGEIKILREQLERLNNQIVVDVVTGSSKFFPFVEHKFYIEGIPVCTKADRLKNKLESRLQELLSVQSQALEFVAEIEDSELRQILILRFIENLTWERVARRMNYADESVPRKRYARFISEHDNDRKIRNKVC